MSINKFKDCIFNNTIQIEKFYDYSPIYSLKTLQNSYLPQQIPFPQNKIKHDKKGVYFKKILQKNFSPISKSLLLIGRTNTGKTYLSKKLIKSPIKPCRTPGHHKFFIHNISQNYLIDSPGYGYSYINKQVQKQNQGFIFDFIYFSFPIVQIYLLIDSKVGVKEFDKKAIELCSKSKLQVQVVLSKIDKINYKKQQILKVLGQIKQFEGQVNQDVFCISSKEGFGIKELETHMMYKLKNQERRQVPEQYKDDIKNLIKNHKTKKLLLK